MSNPDHKPFFSRRPSMATGRPRRDAFTLVELLVVIGIIALLISILLPSLNSARAAAQNVKCLANLRSIAQGMQLYAAENKDAIIGSGVTSGRLFWVRGTLSNSITKSFTLDATSGEMSPTAAFPTDGPISPDDFIGPMARLLRLQLTPSTNLKVRFTDYTNSKYFNCPSTNGATYTAYAGSPDAGTLPVLGYVTNANFTFTAAQFSGGTIAGVTGLTRINVNNGWTSTMANLRVSLVRGSTDKIFIADGVKYSDGKNNLDYNLNPYPNTSTSTRIIPLMYTDYGAWTTATATYDRSLVNGVAGATVDGRLLSFRHGSRKSGAQYGACRMNAAFFDGHAESMEEGRATDPNVWLPRGTVITDSAKVPADVTANHKLTFPYTVN